MHSIVNVSKCCEAVYCHSTVYCIMESIEGVGGGDVIKCAGHIKILYTSSTCSNCASCAVYMYMYTRWSDTTLGTLNDCMLC